MDVEHCRERDIDEPPQIPLAQAELEGEKKAPQEEAQAPQPSQANPPACGQGWRKPLTLFIGKCAFKRAMSRLTNGVSISSSFSYAMYIF